MLTHIIFLLEENKSIGGNRPKRENEEPSTSQPAKKVTNDEAGKAFICASCGRADLKGTAFSAHVGWCKGRTCKCGFYTSNHGHYVYHRAVAHGPRYRCAICKQTNSSPDSLVNHILSHGELGLERIRVYSFFEKID